MKGLIIKEPFASMIVRGEKRWEIRKTNTKFRGEVLIISNGFVIGSARLVDVLGPFSVEELMKYKEFHKVEYDVLLEYSKGKKLYAWVFDDAKEFDEKIKVRIPRGVRVWVRCNFQFKKH